MKRLAVLAAAIVATAVVSATVVRVVEVHEASGVWGLIPASATPSRIQALGRDYDRGGAGWRATLVSVHDALRPGGWLVFETRRPEARDWEHWDVTPTSVTLPDDTSVVVARTVTEVALPLVTFVSETTVDGEAIASASTLRFREIDELEDDLETHGFEVVEVRDAPDRPGKEHVVLARRSAS